MPSFFIAVSDFKISNPPAGGKNTFGEASLPNAEPAVLDDDDGFSEVRFPGFEKELAEYPLDPGSFVEMREPQHHDTGVPLGRKPQNIRKIKIAGHQHRPVPLRPADNDFIGRAMQADVSHVDGRMPCGECLLRRVRDISVEQEPHRAVSLPL